MTEKAPEIEPRDFEDALGRLEGIVKDLERGELSLEGSLARYEQGIRLARFCSEKLEEAEKRIEVLQINESGEPKRDATGAVRTRSLAFDEDPNEE
jgi:exodeoxyribonuclease VII small subunit